MNNKIDESECSDENQYYLEYESDGDRQTGFLRDSLDEEECLSFL